MTDTKQDVPGVQDRALEISLLALRLTVALVMAVWALDKLINPDHAAGVFRSFYGLQVGDAVLLAIGALQLIIIATFVAGAFKTISYGLVLLMHAGSTLSSWQQYLNPFDNLLFFAAWPMLAACLALFLLRDRDRLLTLQI
jgi:putative oxidoreductase